MENEYDFMTIVLYVALAVIAMFMIANMKEFIREMKEMNKTIKSDKHHHATFHFNYKRKTR